jgi:F-type H+-transporting ATPase subunit gamma
MKMHPMRSSTGFIVVTTDKGLCGGMNTNMLRAVTTKLKDVQAAGATAQDSCHWQQGSGFSEPHRCQSA